MLKIIKQTEMDLIIKDTPFFISCFIALFFLMGIYYNYHVWSGQSKDYFGAFITLAIPVISALVFVREKTAIFSKTKRSVVISSRALIKPNATVQIDLASIDSAIIIRPKGGTSATGNKSPQVYLTHNDDNVPLTSYGSISHGSVKAQRIVRTINEFLPNSLIA